MKMKRAFLYGASINYVDKLGGEREGGRPNVNNTTKTYLVNMSTKEVGEGGGQNPKKNCQCMFSMWNQN